MKLKLDLLLTKVDRPVNTAGVLISALAICWITLTTPSAAYSQPKLQKKEPVVLKVPVVLFKPVDFKKRVALSTFAVTEFVAIVEVIGGALAINGDREWRGAGFPLLGEVEVKDVEFDKKTGDTEVRVGRKGNSQWDTSGKRWRSNDLKLRLKGLAAEMLPLVLGKPTEENPHREIYAALGSRFFTGALGDLPADKKETLMTFAHVTAQGTTMSSVTYKENLYLAVDLTSDPNVYNDLQLNQAQRVARVLNDRILALLKAFARPVRDVKGLYGLRLTLEIPHRSFLDAGAETQVDKLEIYASSELVGKFADADITSQKFIDGCVVVLNSNRIEVPLGSS